MKERVLRKDVVDADGCGAWAGDVKLGVGSAELEEPWVLRVMTPRVFNVVRF